MSTLTCLALAIPALAGTTVLEESAANSFADAVAGAGDVDGDGYDDVIVGVPNENSAYLYRGGSLGVDPVVATVLTAGGTDAFFGVTVAGVGDVNADGYADVMVGATNDRFGRGTASLYLGSAGGLSTVTAAVVSGRVNDGLGGSIVAAGDVDGDGYGDVLVGAEGGDGFGWNHRGEARLYRGSATGQLTLLWRVVSAIGTDGYAASLAAGDVDGDGYAEVIVAAPSSGSEGQVHLYRGSAAGPGVTPWITLDGGRSVAAVGDLDLDADVELAVTGENAAGSGVHVFAGSALGPVEVALVGEPDSSLASSAGDVNGDGWGDLLVGNATWNALAGNAQVYLGSAAGLAALGSRTLAGDSDGFGAGQQAGESLAAAGDVDGDGYGDLIVGGSDGLPEQAWVIGGHEDLQIAVGPATPGADLQVDVTSALPGDHLVVLAGPGHIVDGPCPVVLGGLCASIARPRRLGVGVADASGAATLRVPVPSAPVGSTFTVQVAVVRDSGWVSAELSAPVEVVVVP